MNQVPKFPMCLMDSHMTICPNPCPITTIYGPYPPNFWSELSFQGLALDLVMSAYISFFTKQNQSHQYCIRCIFVQQSLVLINQITLYYSFVRITLVTISVFIINYKPFQE